MAGEGGRSKTLWEACHPVTALFLLQESPGPLPRPTQSSQVRTMTTWIQMTWTAAQSECGDQWGTDKSKCITTLNVVLHAALKVDVETLTFNVVCSATFNAARHLLLLSVVPWPPLETYGVTNITIQHCAKNLCAKNVRVVLCHLWCNQNSQSTKKWPCFSRVFFLGRQQKLIYGHYFGGLLGSTPGRGGSTNFWTPGRWFFKNWQSVKSPSPSSTIASLGMPWTRQALNTNL